jgi:hypothetical protein
MWYWCWDGQPQLADLDWYFDVQVRYDNGPVINTLVINPTDATHSEGVWSVEIGTVHWELCEWVWNVQIAVRDRDGNFSGWISEPSAERDFGRDRCFW